MRWDSRVTGVRPVAGGHELTFADGRTETAELVVGADGAWSRIRPLVSAAQPAYCGLSFAEIHIRNADRDHPRQAAAVGKGSLFALDDERGFLAHREPGAELCVYVALQQPADWATSGAISRESLLEFFPDWHDDLRGLITASDGPLVPRPIYALPVGHRWDRVAGVTLVGDAAHLMSPFAGEGANLAMQDGAELAQAIAANPDDVEAALGSFEEAMFARAQAAAEESAANMVLLFGPHGSQRLADMFARFALDRA